MASASALLTVAFVLVVLATAILVLGLVRRAYAMSAEQGPPGRAPFRAFFGLGVWMALTAALASSGVLGDFDARPPPMLVLMAVTVAGSLAIAFSPFGTHLMAQLPVTWLIGFQGFRLPLELVMQRAAEEHVMPIQMSYSGRNLDIVSGITAILVAWMIARGYGTKRTPWLWNLLGTGLLLNVLAVAILSLPGVAHWGPEEVNVWISRPPFVWLPTVLVPFALVGHLLLWRRLLRGQASMAR